MHTVLVLGGYGFFGERIARSLAGDPGIRLLVGGRAREKAIAACASMGLTDARAIGIDASDQAFARALVQLDVATLVHTAGPFQGQDYAVAHAAIEAGCNYVDLADGRDFVAGISGLDSVAKARGVTVVSGASSVPALSSAVIDRHLPDFARLDTLRIGIGSGGRAPGIATVLGVFGYCGKPIRRLEDGRWTETHGWLDLQRHRFPAPVGARLLGSCDVPDLELFPRRYPSVKTVTFHAGFASAPGHVLVWLLSYLVRFGILRDLTPFARPLNWLSRRIEPLVSDKGAMFVTMDGIGRDTQPLRRQWALVAGSNHGAHIPCGAAIALARKLAAGAPLPRGAMACTGLLSVAEYLAPLHELDIREVPA